MKKRVATIIVIEGIENAGFAAYIYRQLSDTLTRLTRPPAKARVIFADENGPKGGLDARCTIVFHVPRRRDLSVTETATSGELAFDAAHATLDTAVTRETGRRRVLVRHPKKYFVAKRLLEPDGETASAAPGRRARRRRVA